MGTRYILRVTTRQNQDAMDYVLVRYTDNGVEALDPEEGWTELPPGHVWRPTFTMTAPGIVDTLQVQRFGWLEPTDLTLV